MARNRIGSTVLIAGCFLAACKGDVSSEDNQPKQKIQGTLDAADFYRPRVKRSGAMSVPGCCTFNVGKTNVERLNSDSYLAVARGSGFEIEIVFGFYEELEKASDSGRKEAVVDGVTLESFSNANAGATRSITWQASVPLTESASARGVVDPVLKIKGKCESDVACITIKNIVNSVRF
jgi:hypothetical protein